MKKMKYGNKHGKMMMEPMYSGYERAMHDSRMMFNMMPAIKNGEFPKADFTKKIPGGYKYK